MKKETLQKRIEKHLYTKSGHVAEKYKEIIELLQNPNSVLRPVQWYSGRTSSRYHLHDNSGNIIEGLKALGIDYETGNDAPRGGKNGYFVKLTAKGRRQVADYNKQK